MDDLKKTKEEFIEEVRPLRWIEWIFTKSIKPESKKKYHTQSYGVIKMTRIR